MNIAITLLAVLIEAITGYPDGLLQAIGHPVTWIGRLIAVLDRLLNRAAAGDFVRRAAGLLAVFALVAVPAAIAYAIESWLLRLPYGFLAVSILASTLIAQRSLHRHVRNVALALDQDGLEAGRAAVARIVGRDTAALDTAGVCRAAIESLAENFSDGIVAPVVWLAVGGLAGGTAYKAINTADSMIGHKSPRYRAFGFAAARLDDVVNLPASRLSALLLIAAAATCGGVAAAQAWRVVCHDARRHRSPNAGWPEAAMAGALGLSLAGPRVYGGTLVDDAPIGDGRREVDTKDIRAALALYRRADFILIALVAVLAVIAVSGRG